MCSSTMHLKHLNGLSRVIQSKQLCLASKAAQLAVAILVR